MDANDNKEKSRSAFNEQAPRYDEDVCGDHARRLYPHVLEALAEAYPGAGRVLDVGCGTGALLERVADVFPDAELHGIDLSPAMVERAHARLAARAELCVGDAEHLPYHDGSFQVVICNDSFHHYPDPRRAAFEFWRVLAPGGALVLGDCWQPAPARALMNLFLPFSCDGDVRIYSEDELRAILRAWFSRVSWHRVGMTACLAVAVK